MLDKFNVNSRIVNINVSTELITSNSNLIFWRFFTILFLYLIAVVNYSVFSFAVYFLLIFLNNIIIIILLLFVVISSIMNVIKNKAFRDANGLDDTDDEVDNDKSKVNKSLQHGQVEVNVSSSSTLVNNALQMTTEVDSSADQPRRSSQSAWSKWSQDRRSLSNKGAATSGTGDFRTTRNERIMSLFEQLTQVQRTPTPIMKAREESKHLVAPEIAESYGMTAVAPITCGNDPQKRKSSSCARGSRRGAISYHQHHHQYSSCGLSSTVKLSYMEIQLLNEYWDHSTFVKSRKWGVLSGLFSLCLQLFSFFSSKWIFYGEKRSPNFNGLWWKCFVKNNTCYFVLHDFGNIPNWMKSVMLLYILACLCCVLASVFSFGGLLKKDLPKKLYYYHSSAEFFCVSGLSSSVGLIVYTIMFKETIQIMTPWSFSSSSSSSSTSTKLEGSSVPPSLSYFPSIDRNLELWSRLGYGYSLAWIGSFLALSAFVMLRLDEFVQDCSQPIDVKILAHRIMPDCLRHHKGSHEQDDDQFDEDEDNKIADDKFSGNDCDIEDRRHGGIAGGGIGRIWSGLGGMSGDSNSFDNGSGGGGGGRMGGFDAVNGERSNGSESNFHFQRRYHHYYQQQPKLLSPSASIIAENWRKLIQHPS